MFLTAICSNIFGATSAEDIGITPGHGPGRRGMTSADL
jgi:hypothetical protein